MGKLTNNVWFKCISVLLIISVILGGLLAILNDVLYVSPEERTGRAIKKIYGTEISDYKVVLDVDNDSSPIEYDIGRINKIYIIGDENSEKYDTLYQTTGYTVYKNGTITLWIKVSHQGDEIEIDKVIMESYDKQTLMSKLDSAYYENFLKDVTEPAKNGEIFTTEQGQDLSNPVSGATYSANAGNNAVNCVLKHLGGATNEK